MYIAFEGIDGSGKDTQLKLVFEYLLAENKYNNIFKTQEPSGIGKYGKEISEKIINKGFKNQEEALTLYVNDRLESQDIKRALLQAPQTYILSSRCDLTSYAYQTLSNETEKGFSFDEVYNYHNNNGNKVLVPDLILFFDISAEDALKRISQRNEIEGKNEMDVFENYNFLNKAANQYHKAIDYLRDVENRDIKIIDATQDIDTIANQVLSHIEEKKHQLNK